MPLGQWTRLFTLEELIVYDPVNEISDLTIEQHLRLNLHVLKINATQISVLDQAFQMPNLEHLSVSFSIAEAIDQSFWNTHNFNTSNSIRILHVHGLQENEGMVMALRAACPNLNQLNIAM